MKVLMLGWELPPHNSGGLGVACYQLCKAISAQDVDLEFIVPYEADYTADFMTVTAARPIGLQQIDSSTIAYDSHKYVSYDGHTVTHDIYAQQLLYEQAVSRLIETKEFDIVHAHDWLTFRAALRIKERMGCPIVLHVHSVESDRAGGNQGNPLVHEIEATSLTLADQIIAVSDFTKQAIMRDYHIPSERITVVHNSIDRTSFESLSDDTAYHYLAQLKGQGYKVVTNIGRLTVQKGLPHLLRAAQEVLKRAPKTMFLIVGSGEQYHELLELAAELGISRNVLFTGFQRGKNWRDAFAIADLFVMPSVSEPFGLTPLEAAGYGTPSIISKQSGVSEVLRNCLKVDFWDEHEMANQIVAVVQHDALRDTLLANAQAEFATLSWDKAAQQLTELYRHHTLAGAAA